MRLGCQKKLLKIGDVEPKGACRVELNRRRIGDEVNVVDEQATDAPERGGKRPTRPGIAEIAPEQSRELIARVRTGAPKNEIGQKRLGLACGEGR